MMRLNCHVEQLQQADEKLNEAAALLVTVRHQVAPNEARALSVAITNIEQAHLWVAAAIDPGVVAAVVRAREERMRV